MTLEQTHSWAELLSTRVAIGIELFCTGSCARAVRCASACGVPVGKFYHRRRPPTKCPKCNGDQLFTKVIYRYKEKRKDDSI